MFFRLMIILGLFAVALAGIMGFYYYINSDLPPAGIDNRPGVSDDDPMANPGIKGGSATAPPA